MYNRAVCDYAKGGATEVYCNRATTVNLTQTTCTLDFEVLSPTIG